MQATTHAYNVSKLPPHLLSVAGLMIELSRPTANLEQSQQLSQPNHIQSFEFGNVIRVSHLTMLTTWLKFTVTKPELELFAHKNSSNILERRFGIICPHSNNQAKTHQKESCCSDQCLLFHPTFLSYFQADPLFVDLKFTGSNWERGQWIH
jgi:hypothetical protein